LAIELFNAAQAFDFRKQQTGLSSSKCIEDFVKSYREKVAFVQDDVVMYELIHKSIDFLRDQQ
ncbi:MAG: histidine ammonia-lyase, partial [Bacteroidales bacterium]|jgi:histidine ammonia-lyase|nr:histidine ammonia-lyase [Bacteroidales bacterium]